MTYRIQNLQKPSLRMVVHFNCLKEYSSNMRMNSDLTSVASDLPLAQSLQPPPLGTNLEIIYNELTSTSEPHFEPSTNRSTNEHETESNSNEQINESSNNECTSDIERGPPVINTTRYPRRNRRAPDYYHDELQKLYRIWDGFSDGGELCSDYETVLSLVTHCLVFYMYEHLRSMCMYHARDN